jgi:hypothetical protein
MSDMVNLNKTLDYWAGYEAARADLDDARRPRMKEELLERNGRAILMAYADNLSQEQVALARLRAWHALGKLDE